MSGAPEHITRPEFQAVVRELRLTIVVSALAANAIVDYASPIIAGGVAAVVAIGWKVLPFLLHR